MCISPKEEDSHWAFTLQLKEQEVNTSDFLWLSLFSYFFLALLSPFSRRIQIGSSESGSLVSIGLRSHSDLHKCHDEIGAYDAFANFASHAAIEFLLVTYRPL